MIFLTLALLAQQLPAQNFPAIDRPGTDPLAVPTVRSLCGASGPLDAPSLLATERREAAAAESANTAAAWLELGCTRALLSTTKAGSHGGPLMQSGDSWAQGAITTVIKVLELHPGDSRAADLLSVFAMDEPDAKTMGKALDRLTSAIAAGAHGSPTFRACAELGMRLGRVDVARRCVTSDLAIGRDSTELLLLLARLDARDHDTVSTTDAFVTAAAAAHDTIAKLAINWQLQWFLTPDELHTWPTLPDSARGPWVRDRLASRDVRDGQPPGARLAEHFQRLEYADSAFRLKVPSRIRNSMMHGASVESMGTDPNGFPDSWRDYSRWQLDLDDRGVTWMRFGAPLKRQSKSVGNSSYEVWYYELDGQPLLLTFAYEPFSGSVGPSRLITGLINDIYCGIDTWRCTLALRGRVPVEIRQQVRQQDREYISAATTNDDNSPRGAKEVEVIARLNRLWDPISGAPMSLVTYAVKAADLSVQKSSSGPRTALLDFDLRRYDAIGDVWQDTSFSRHLVLPDSNNKKLHVTGFVIVPSSASVTSWSLVASQPDRRRGRAWDVASQPLDRSPIALSDLVLGQEGQGITWSNHNAAISLAPLNAVDRKLPVSLYYQIRSDADRAPMKTTAALYRVENSVPRDTPALQVGFSQVIHQGINEAAPTLDVSRLDHGSYRLEVTVEDDKGTVVTRRWVSLNLN